MGYSMIEMIDNRLDQLFPQRDLYTFSPFSVENLRDNIIMFIIKDAYAESERKKSLRANRGTDSDADRMRDSRNIAYAQHYRNLQYERVKEEIGEQISELLPDDISSMEDKIVGHKLTEMQYFELNTMADHPLLKTIISKRICDVKKVPNNTFVVYMDDYDQLVSELIDKLDGNDADVIFATIALFTLEWKYNVDLFYSFAAEAEKHKVKELPIERLGLLCAGLAVPLPPYFTTTMHTESRFVLHRPQLVPCIFDKDEAGWDEIKEKMWQYLSAEYFIHTEIVHKWSMPEFFYTHIDRSQWAAFFREHYDIRKMYVKKEWTNKRIRFMRQTYQALLRNQPTPGKI